MLVIVLVLTAQFAWSKNMERGPVRGPSRSLDVANPQDENYVLFNGKLATNFTNYGYFGNDGPSQVGALEDWCIDGWAPQFEYPYGSGVQYLFQGAVWIGAEVETDSGYVTRVSVGTDGWQNPAINEFHAGEAPGHGILLRSNLTTALDCDGNSIYDPTAKANYEYTATFSDTLTDRLFVRNDPTDGAHQPLGLEITQTARLWQNPGYARFVIYEFKVKNIGSHNLRNIYFGLYMDSDVGEAGYSGEHTDDLSGSILVDPAQGTILGWSADNDGYRDESFGPPLVAPHAIGVAALTNQFELGTREFANSFNWYRPNGDISLDYGPSWADSINDDWIVNGTPEGDFGKYHLLSSRERDFDESTLYETHEPQIDTVYACVSGGESHAWHEYEEEPFPDVTGWDTRFMLSYGPLGEFDHFEDGKCITRLNPGEEFTFTTVVLIGENFHDPDNPQMPPGIDTSKFDLSGLIDSYHRAKQLYDTNYEFQPMPPVPDFHVYQAMNESVPLRWERPGFGNVTGYLVSGRSDSGRRQEVQFTDSPITTTYYTISGLSNGDWWQFIVRAVDNEGTTVAADTMIQVGAIPNYCTLEGKRVVHGDSLWWNYSNDPHQAGYKLVRTSAVDTVVLDNINARTYVDSNFVSGRTYTYRLYIKNELGVEGLPTEPIELTPYSPTASILVLDETKHPGPVQYQRGAASDSSIRAFYERILTAMGESYDYFDTDEEPLESLEQLGRYQIVLLHHDNTVFPGRNWIEAEEQEGILKSFVEMGGKLVRGGRGVFADAGLYNFNPRLYDVELGTLTFDSIFVARAFNTVTPRTTTRTSGATAMDTLFPNFNWDSNKTPLLRYANLTYPFLSEVDLMWPNGQTRAIYTAVMHESDSTGYIDPPCAVIGPRTVFFGFPLYFVPESQAQQILESSLYVLRHQVLETPEPPNEPLPTAYALKQNYPNPFNANTVIEFALPVTRTAALRIYNIRGQLVSTLADGTLNAGDHRVSFDAAGLASGLYFYRLEVGSESIAKKLLLLK